MTWHKGHSQVLEYDLVKNDKYQFTHLQETWKKRRQIGSSFWYLMTNNLDWAAQSSTFVQTSGISNVGPSWCPSWYGLRLGTSNLKKNQVAAPFPKELKGKIAFWHVYRFQIYAKWRQKRYLQAHDYWWSNKILVNLQLSMWFLCWGQVMSTALFCNMF